MKAIAFTPGTPGARLVERPEPAIAAADQILMKVLDVGICGTDREEAAGGRAQAPPGNNELILGHEMFGQVLQVGSAVRSVAPGDYGAFTVRRECGRCPACAMNRSDMCYTGGYTERGIQARDGFQCERVVDDWRYFVKIPEEIVSIGVLTEPMSVAQKAIDEAVRIQTVRLPDVNDPAQWARGRFALVAGLGPVGLLAAFALRLRGAEVIGLDVVDSGDLKARLIERIGGVYFDGRGAGLDQLRKKCPRIDLIFEATGVPSLEFDLLEALGINGVYVLTGIPGGDRPTTIPGAALIRGLVLKNQVMAGSVNESIAHFEAAVRDLAASRAKWDDAIGQVITERLPYTEFARALDRRAADGVKTVLEWR